MKLFSGIQHKIILPFSCVFLAVFAVTAVLTARVVINLQEKIAQKQASDMARFVNEARLPLSVSLMERIESVTGKEVGFYDADHQSFSTTLGGIADSRPTEQQVLSDATVWRAFSAPIGNDGSRLYLLMKESDLTSETRQAVRPIFVLAGIGAIITLVIGWLITVSITRPIRALAAAAEEIAPHNEPHEGHHEGSGDEVANLSDAFERMLVRLEEAQEQLIESEKLAAVGRVTTGIAHEIRNPLAAMKMNVQILQEQMPDDDTATLIIKDIERLQLLIDELLTHGSPMRLNRESLQLSTVLRECLATLDARLRHAHVDVVCEFDSHLPPVQIDPGRMTQVVINLILNAVEAMPGGGRLTVRTRRSDGELVAEIADTGCGIDPEIAPQIFDAFFSTREGGIGIGLAVSRRIAEEHGGRLEFESCSPGTVFRIHLPIKS